jgi:hypothetical protein
MKKLLFGLLVTCSLTVKAQVYNNEWIQDFSKSYYKFKVGKDGLFRISKTLLDSAGLGNVPAEQFQLWRNGVQVPIYTSVFSGTFPSGAYIEFWGQMNDGIPDKQLYRNPNYQVDDKWSLSTDTSTYFLTTSSNISTNLRIINDNNDVAGTTLTKDPYFIYTAARHFKDKINSGKAVNVGENLYSASYDKCEGWSSADIVTSASTNGITYGSNTSTLNNLFVYTGTGAPSPSFKIGLSGNANYLRRYTASINGDSVLGNQFIEYTSVVDSAPVNLNTLISNSATISVKNIAFVECPTDLPCQIDRIVIHKYELTYPRQFNFGGSSNFEFSLPANSNGNYIEISNFVYGSIAPILYDLSNNKRYVADLTSAPLLKFVLPPSDINRKLVLVSEDASNLNAIARLQSILFKDYSKPDQVGDYLIISHPYLFNGSNGNPVEDYRAYRSSAAGGSFDAKIYLSDELIDQFAFGIKKNPLGIRNFIRFARKTFPVTPKHVFIIGSGIYYTQQKSLENSADVTVKSNLDRLNLVPTFGWPASDILLTAEPGSSIPEIPIGRISVVFPQEVTVYLNKVKEYEQAQANLSPSSDRKWMKNVIHIVGASDDNLGSLLSQSMEGFRKIIIDTLYGANVSTFSKSSADAVQQLNSQDLTNLINNGTSLITYFGHSSASTLEFNLDNPENYSNQGKYPLFIGLGCNAGNFFSYNPTRFITKETLSEKYVLFPNRGTIGFISSTHFGIVQYLDIWNSRAYKRISNTSYGKSIGEIMKKTAEDVFSAQSQEDFYARANVEESELHGDPAITLNTPAKADYVIEDPMVKVTPGFVSVADASFKVEVKSLNLGKAVKNNIIVEVKRQYPDQSIVEIKRDTLFKASERSLPTFSMFQDSVSLIIPIDPIHDKGLNKIIVTVDPDNEVDELFETNNSVTKDVMIFEDEARPVYPYNYAIINKNNIKLFASTANAFSPSKEYRMEIDTTEQFNSPLKVVKSLTQAGGVLEFDPGLSFIDSTVYYWRVAPVPATGPYAWNTASFIYLPNSEPGFNQSHYFQHLKSDTKSISLDSISRDWGYNNSTSDLFVRNGVFPTAANFAVDFSVAINGDAFMRSVCGISNIIVNVIDSRTFQPWLNSSAGSSRYGSDPVCADDRKYNFQFNILDTNKRRKLVEFLDLIPKGFYVIVRNTSGTEMTSNTYPNTWRNDTTYLGAGNSIYHRLYNQGFKDIDSFNRPRAWIFVYKKDDASEFQSKYSFSQGLYDKITLAATCNTRDTIGYISSPQFGPAKAWKQLIWSGTVTDSIPGDDPNIDIIGLNYKGQADTLFKNLNLNQRSFDISSINAKQYPFLKLQLRNVDTINYTPFQLRYWRILNDPAPEGAMAPNIFYSMSDTLDVAEPLNFKIAFKNVSEVNFSDSIKIKATVTDKNNVMYSLPVWKQKALVKNDTLLINNPIDTRKLTGNNSVFVEVNPDNDQPEMYHFNNVFYKAFYVRPDTLNPVMDVTFDNVHILNHDIVSARPDILIKLKDEAKWFLLNDTSTIKVQVRFPDGHLQDYNYDGSTMEFIPAQQAPNTNNTATVNVKPFFDQDGDYELIVLGKDMSQNQAGLLQYRVAFQVYNKAMISNMLNYPNPFTTSTAFVFTITGSEVPQNIKIQILTVTGKIVREITKDELGPLHIGRNITEFKWDGTDQYGQNLGNGIYLYRVVTNLNGKSLDKFNQVDANGKSYELDKYFNKGYGKMYLMR